MNTVYMAARSAAEKKNLLQRDKNVKIIKKEFEASDMEGKDIAIAATNIKELNKEVQQIAKANKVLVTLPPPVVTKAIGLGPFCLQMNCLNLLYMLLKFVSWKLPIWIILAFYLYNMIL